MSDNMRKESNNTDITPEILDENLRRLLTGGMVYTDKERSIAAILHSDGYVNLTATTGGDICTITAKGRAFVAQGGYIALRKAREKEESRNNRIRKEDNARQWTISTLGYIVTVIASLLSFLLGKCT